MKTALFVVQFGAARIEYVVSRQDRADLTNADTKRLQKEWDNATGAFPDPVDYWCRIRWVSCAGYDFERINTLSVVSVSA